MGEFNRGDFIYDRHFLTRNYKLISGGTESLIYKVSDDLVAKRFYYPRDLKMSAVHDKIVECDPQAILTSNDFLIYNKKIYAQFMEYFKGHQNTNIYDIKFDVLLKFIKNILIDIEELTCNNIEMNDTTPASFIYSDSDMKLIDTTKYHFSRYNYKHLYDHNLDQLFLVSDLFKSKQYEDDFLRDLVDVTGNKVLYDMQHDYLNYEFFIKELQKTYKDFTNINIHTINEGRNIVRLLK